ncbi:ryncolin-4-like [Saccostrea cucullata]|uniref:ryncolin-4-like n=1 Tax=Saccostrea cuccullata TaxID=36930 RepID=UPI002ED4C809
MNTLKFLLFLGAMATASILEPADECVIEKTSFHSLQNIASQVVKQQGGNCNGNGTISTGINQRNGHSNEFATKEDIKEIEQKLVLMHSLFQNCLRDTCNKFYPEDCQDLLLKGYRESKVYTIFPKTGLAYQVYCDQETDGGGWMVIQRRQDGSENFFRTWNEYKNGFGSLGNEFWLGNDKIHTITSSGNYKLRIDLKDFSGNSRYATYNTFSIGDERSGYILNLVDYNGDAEESINRMLTAWNGITGQDITIP